MPEKSFKSNEAMNGNCLGEDLLYRYLEKMTTQEEDKRIEQHLNKCNNCFADVTALTEMIQTPMTEAEKIEVAQTRKITPEKQVQKILDYIAAENRLLAPHPGVLARLKFFFENFIQPLLSPRLAPVAAILAVVMIGALIFGIRYRNRDSSALAQVEQVLQQGYQVYFNPLNFSASIPRLSGGYRRVPTYRMGPGDETPVYLREARQNLTTALTSDPESVRAMHLLAQTFIIQGRYTQGDSVLHRIPAAALKEAELLNDQGVLHLAMTDTVAAVQDFETAIKINPKLVEARYNLALVRAKQGAIAEAIANLEAAVQGEPDEDWRSSIASVLEELKSSNQ